MSTGLLIAVGAAGFEAALLRVAESGRELHVVRRCVDLADLLASAATRQAQVALVSAELTGLDRATVARLREERLAVVGAVDGSPDQEAMLRRVGVTDLLPTDALDGLASVVAEAVLGAPRGDHVPQHAAPGSGAGSAREGGGAQVLAVWGPAGAPGRSTVALGVADELARAGLPTLLIDVDVYGGSLAQALGMLDESSGLLAATRAANTGQLDNTVLADLARRVDDLSVLTGLPRADRWTEVRPALLRELIAVARSSYRWTVLDCAFSLESDEELSHDTSAPRRNGATLTALAEADTVLVVARPDAIGLGRLVRGLAELAVAVPSARPRVVVNGMRGTLGWSAGEVRATLQRLADVADPTFLPADRTACDRALVHGRTLADSAPDSRLTAALGKLAGQLAGLPTPGRRSWWRL
ncbi:MAG TPA: hypothetical protein VFI30_00685 [Nocardioidaceae bacterium]|nr:hypothetical protein [Nocardioidaceae bacterium]